MILSICIGEVFVDYDDQSNHPTLDGVESVLDRLVNAAVTASCAIRDDQDIDEDDV